MLALFLATILVALALHELRRELATSAETAPGALMVVGLVLRMLVVVMVFVLASFWLAVLAGRV
jgi:hypothetical protein